MKHLRGLIYRNLVTRPVRSIALILLGAVLSLSVFTGTCTVQSLERGFGSMRSRMGADIMVVPYAALSRKNFDNEILLGNADSCYMPSENVDEIAQMEGVRRISAQFYLTSTELDCCDTPVHLMAYDPETDFTVAPWILESDGGEIGPFDVAAGCDIRAQVGDTLTIFGTSVTVAAKLDRSDTDYDSTIFADMETICALAGASGDEKLQSLTEGGVDLVSAVLVDAADGYDMESVKNDINIHIKKIRAIQSQNVLSGVSSGMSGVSDTAKALMAAVWIVSAGVMAAASLMMTGERKKEFAVLRVLGASRRKLAAIVLGEALTVSAAGSLAGILPGLLAVAGGAGWLEKWLGLPFLLPGAGVISLDAALAVLVTALTGAGAASFAARRIIRQDTGTIIRSE